MQRAKYIGKTYGTGFDRNSVYLEYEYRGERYTVHENRAKGNEPTAWQHRNAQASIDRMLDTPAPKATEDAMIGFNLFMDYVDGKVTEEDF